jgi:hypothetical protein
VNQQPWIVAGFSASDTIAAAPDEFPNVEFAIWPDESPRSITEHSVRSLTNAQKPTS